jgi:S-adenosylmethionine decarboxylase
MLRLSEERPTRFLVNWRARKTMTPGSETIVDALGCSASALCDLDVMRRLCERLTGDLELQVVGDPQWHVFPAPGGVTGLYLLSESHLACHTYPEFGLATFNLYCCREHVSWDWRCWLEHDLRAQRVVTRVVARGEPAPTVGLLSGGYVETVPVERNASLRGTWP